MAALDKQIGQTNKAYDHDIGTGHANRTYEQGMRQTSEEKMMVEIEAKHPEQDVSYKRVSLFPTPTKKETAKLHNYEETTDRPTLCRDKKKTGKIGLKDTSSSYCANFYSVDLLASFFLSGPFHRWLLYHIKPFCKLWLNFDVTV